MQEEYKKIEEVFRTLKKLAASEVDGRKPNRFIMSAKNYLLIEPFLNDGYFGDIGCTGIPGAPDDNIMVCYDGRGVSEDTVFGNLQPYPPPMPFMPSRIRTIEQQKGWEEWVEEQEQRRKRHGC